MVTFKYVSPKDTTTAIIQFDPYVSTLDLFNRSRYGVNDLIPVIFVVVTRFTKIYVELSHRYLRKTYLRPTY